ncbi:hypothetical protein LE190_14325 [Massilia oculi]|uniref:Prepilin-type N-terminal cleavage/methylation domain-containing protein n=1 Tax=Massilia hydrophila TaxID=3044279 RepID=A0ABS7YFT3_9BURK|nr:hypothetical protein [Massilia oculi]MCA1857094.1 hypothetical protein [Massilia oculi]
MKNQTGLTLFEMACALATISFVIGTIFSVNQFLDRSTAKRLLGEMQEVKHVMHAYRDRYRAVPGDDWRASTHVPGTKSASSEFGDNGLIDGADQWSSHSTNSNDSTLESGLFWQHVRMAGLARGEPSYLGAFNAVRGRLGVTSTSRIPTRPGDASGPFNVCSSAIPGKLARMMDEEADDGDATSGIMWAASETASTPITAPTLPTPYENSARYSVCMAF